MHASVTVDGVSSGAAVEVAVIAPVVTASSADLAANSTSMTINGLDFDSNPANDSVAFDSGVTGTVTGTTSNSLTVSLTGLSSLTADTALHVSVTVDTVSSGAEVQVATVAPVITSSSADLPATATSLTIAGFGFDPIAGNDSVTFDNGVTGTVTFASGTSLTVSVTGLSVLTADTASMPALWWTASAAAVSCKLPRWPRWSLPAAPSFLPVRPP